jgi:diguanylate cyclase
MSNPPAFPPVYSDAAQQASENLRRVLPLINQHKTPVNPVNYAVWYEYVSGDNKALSAAINTRLDKNEPITTEVTQNLYEKYVLMGMPERLEKANNGITLVVNNTLKNLNKAESTAGECAADLSNTENVLENCTDIEVLKAVVHDILSNTQTLTASSNELKQELAKSSQEMKRLSSELDTVKEIARIDGLTGLLNRGAFDKELLALCTKSDVSIALTMFDLDHFKQLNDTFGHVVGDKVLQFFSTLLKKYAGDNHLAARYGGEEMVMILFNVSQHQAVQMAEEIRSELSDSNLKQKKNGQTLGQTTVSAGVSLFQLGDTPNSLIDRADKALYISKENGRNQVNVN